MTTNARSLPTRLSEWAHAHPRLLGASVIVAALALVGVAFILATTLFSGVPVAGAPDPTATPTPRGTPAASASPEPSDSAAPSGSPAATPLAGPPWPPVADPDVGFLLPPMWAVSVVNDLNVRSGPGAEFPAIAQLDAGDLAKVIDIQSPGWVSVAVDGATGYASVGPEDDPYLRGTKTPWLATFGSMAGVVSDGDAYLAYGSHAQFDYPPYELHGLPALALRSEDGITWTPLEAGPESSIRSVAASDAGWVAVIEIPLGGTLLSFSADGKTWESAAGVDSGLSAVAHGPAGWVATGDAGSWTSVDGQNWDGPHAIGSGDPPTQLELESSGDGYVTFNRYSDRLFTTVDGVTWAPNDHGGFRISDAELVGDEVWVVVAAEDGATSIRRGAVGAGGISWSSAPTGIGGSGLHVDRISSGPEGMLAVGWDEASLEAIAWRSQDGGTWNRVEPGTDALDRVGPFEPVWGPAGWVGPDLERSSDGAAWLASDYELAYDGPMPPCPPADKVSTLVLGYLGEFAAGCFGESSITIRGWVGELGFGGCCPPFGEPEWLASTFPPAILHSGDPGDTGANYQLVVYPPPEVDRSAARSAGHVGRDRRQLQRSGLRRVPMAAEPDLPERAELTRGR